MVDPSFTIIAAKERKLLRIAFAPGFWDDATKRRFIEACINAIIALDCELGTQVILVDLRNAVLQSQDMIETMRKFLADPQGGRIALVAETPLARMQTRRLQVRDEVRMFADMTTAEQWLFSRDSARAA